MKMKLTDSVLIESDWNLKLKQIRYGPPLSTVLIESDWNLKEDETSKADQMQNSINRISLQIKSQG